MDEGKHLYVTQIGWWCLAWSRRPPSLPHQNQQNPALPLSLSTGLPFHSSASIYSSPSLHLLSVGLPLNAQPKQRLSGWRLWTGVWGLAEAESDAFGTGWEIPSTRPGSRDSCLWCHDSAARLRPTGRLAKVKPVWLEGQYSFKQYFRSLKSMLCFFVFHRLIYSRVMHHMFSSWSFLRTL